jgi:hypothetical protein
MDRDEILKSAQNNGNKGKEYERHALLRGDNIAACIGMLIGIVMILAKLWVKKEFDFGVCGIVFIVSCIQSINEGAKFKKWWLIVAGIVEGLIALIMLLAYVGALIIG